MAEKYTRVYSLSEQFYCPGAPVIIEAGALLKNNDTGAIIAQLKFKNISSKVIRALTIKISAKDISGADVAGVDSFQYLDLSVNRNESFGAKTPIVLPSAVSRSFSCECVSAVFSDQTTWTREEGAQWHVLPPPVLLKAEIGAALIDQYQRDTKSKSVYKVTDHEDLWYCGCGALNRSHETSCSHCHLDKSVLLAALDLDSLTANKNIYDADVVAKQAALVDAKQRQAKKIKKLSIVVASAIVLLLALVLLVTNVIIPTINYNNAVALMEAGKYTEAIVAFEALDGYKDSIAQIEACKTAVLDEEYNKAIALMEEGKYTEAIDAFTALDGYKDSIAQIKACKTAVLDEEYNKAIALLDAKDEAGAMAIFMRLGNYKDSAAISFRLAFNGDWEWIHPGLINPWDSFTIDTEAKTVTYIFDSTASGSKFGTKKTTVYRFKHHSDTTIGISGLRGEENISVYLEICEYGKIRVIYLDETKKPSSDDQNMYLVRKN